VEVRAFKVIHDLKALLPYGVLLIPSREKRDMQCCCTAKVVLTQGGEGDVRHHLDAGVGLATNDGPNHDFMGSKGIVTLASHLSKSWALDSRQR
jgi:hypothetical protein